MMLRHARGELALDRCLVMGIVNRTPDSFYDGGRMALDAASGFAERLVEDGADLLDLGAVKAGPGAPVSEEEELERLVPLVERLVSVTEVPLSIESGRPRVVEAAVEAGAAIVNDVSGLLDPELAPACARLGCGLVLMHHGGQIRGRPRHPRYGDVVEEVRAELERLAASARDAGVPPGSIVIDPGLDFGKTTYHSLELMRKLPRLTSAGYPVLVAASRKDVVGETLGLPPAERLEGSLALVVLTVLGGGAIVRVHDVQASQRAVAMTEAVLGHRDPASPVRGLWD